MVRQRANNSIGRSFRKLRSSISNSFKKSNYLSKPSSNYGENLNNESFEPSGSFRDHRLMFAERDSDVRAAFSEPTSLDLENSGDNNDEDLGAPASAHNGTRSLSLGYFNAGHYPAMSKGQHQGPSSDHQLWNEYVDYLTKDEFDSIYREYVDRNGRDFLNVGLRTYIDAVIETKRFRNRCFQVLSRNSAISHPPSYYNHEGVSSGRADPVYRSYLSPEPSYARIHDKRYSGCPGNDLSHGNNYNTYNGNTYNGYGKDSWNLVGVNFTPERAPFPQEQQDHSATADRPVAETAAVTVHRFDDFISNYDYLNSTNRFNDFKSSDAPSPSSRAAASGANLPLPVSSLMADSPAHHSTAEINEALSHNEKLRLLEKIGIDDDYIAKRVCSKFSGRSGTKAFVGNNEKRSLEEFNLFHKENLKSQLDLSEQLSQELMHISNLNTPDALDARLRSSDYNARSTDLFKSTLSDSLAEGSSLFRRISDTIDRNRDASPVNILSLTYS